MKISYDIPNLRVIGIELVLDMIERAQQLPRRLQNIEESRCNSEREVVNIKRLTGIGNASICIVICTSMQHRPVWYQHEFHHRDSVSKRGSEKEDGSPSKFALHFPSRFQLEFNENGCEPKNRREDMNPTDLKVL
eukprot:scaffold22575_cov56-Cyclotella_meneghiniana.AAC.1